MRRRSLNLVSSASLSRLALVALSLATILTAQQLAAPSALAQSRTWFYMPTGNGHGFQIFDRREGKITYFLEHPYRFVAPSGTNLPVDRTTPGVGRRDLAHDIYFGVSTGSENRWLNQINTVVYEDQTNIIKATQRVGGVEFDSYFFSPFGLEANAMVMLIRARGEAGAEVSVFAKPNLKFGAGGSRTDPDDRDEQLTWRADDGVAVETGAGGGHAMYVPIGGIDVTALGEDSRLYQSVLNAGRVMASDDCRETRCVFVGQKNLTLDENGEAWWGLAVLFVNDTPNHPQSQAFRDMRNAETVLNQWREFAGEKDAKTLHQAVLDEWTAWRVDRAPAELTEEERKIWLQSETVLRMGQVREPMQDNRKNLGMFLAALPIGEWHTGWVRDGVYAVVSMAMNGHFEEARLGAEFFLNARRASSPS